MLPLSLIVDGENNMYITETSAVRRVDGKDSILSTPIRYFDDAQQTPHKIVYDPVTDFKYFNTSDHVIRFDKYHNQTTLLVTSTKIYSIALEQNYSRTVDMALLKILTSNLDAFSNWPPGLVELVESYLRGLAAATGIFCCGAVSIFYFPLK